MRTIRDVVNLANDSVLIIDLGSASSAKKERVRRIGESKEMVPDGPLVF